MKSTKQSMLSHTIMLNAYALNKKLSRLHPWRDFSFINRGKQLDTAIHVRTNASTKLVRFRANNFFVLGVDKAGSYD